MFKKSEVPSGWDNKEKTYPFSDMNIGDCVETSHDMKKVQRYSHAYGAMYNMKFRTRTTDGTLKIWRVA